MFTALSQHSVFATLPNPNEMASRINFKMTVNGYSLTLQPRLILGRNSFKPKHSVTTLYLCLSHRPIRDHYFMKAVWGHGGRYGCFWLYSGAHEVEVGQPMVNRS